MALRKLLTRPLPEVPSQAPGVRSMIEQTLSTPQLVPVRLFWDNLRASRGWLPVLAPLLVWVFWRTYQRERAKVKQEHSQV